MNPLMRMDYLLLLAAVAMAFVAFCSWRSFVRGPRAARLAAVGLRGAAMAVLAVIAINPGRWVTPYDAGRSRLAVMVDGSGSMATADAGGESRWDAARGALDALLTSLPEEQPVDLYRFSDGLRRTRADALDAVSPRGDTDIDAAVSAVLNHYPDAGALRGVVLLSDGRQVLPRRQSDPALRAQAYGIPFVCAGFGGRVVQPDVALDARRSLIVGFAGQSIRVPVRIRSTGLDAVRADLDVRDAEGDTLVSTTVTVPADSETTTRLAVPPLPPGSHTLTLATTAWPEEKTDLNNADQVGVLILADRVRVLMCEGVPNWDSKFLAQLLREEEGVDVTSVFRLAADRYFRIADAAALEEARRTTTPFPDTVEDLAAYDAVIFGKGSEYFLSPERVNALRGFVADHGGCVVFARGKPYDAAFEELEPIEPVEWGSMARETLRLTPTRRGVAAGLFGELLPGPDAEIWAQAPPIAGGHRVARVRGFAQVLAEGDALTADAVEDKLPLIVSRRYGKGLAVLMNMDGMWKWDFFPGNKAAADIYATVWVQLLYWASVHTEFLPGQAYAIRVARSVLPFDQAASVTVAARRKTPPDEVPAVTVTGGDGFRQVLRLGGDAGAREWTLRFDPEQPGHHRLVLTDAEDGDALGPETAVQVLGPPREGDNRSADMAYLERLSELSGGERVAREALNATVARLVAGGDEVGEAQQAVWEPAWDRGWLLLVTVALLTVEWVLRRRNGMI